MISILQGCQGAFARFLPELSPVSCLRGSAAVSGGLLRSPAVSFSWPATTARHQDRPDPRQMPRWTISSSGRRPRAVEWDGGSEPPVSPTNTAPADRQCPVCTPSASSSCLLSSEVPEEARSESRCRSPREAAPLPWHQHRRTNKGPAMPSRLGRARDLTTPCPSSHSAPYMCRG